MANPMPSFNLPLSGDVTQSINPFSWFMNAMGSQFGFININMTRSTNPAVEAEVVTHVASYGRQLGRIEDALLVLFDVLEPEIEGKLTVEQKTAVKALRRMTDAIQEVRQQATPRSNGG